MNTLPPELADAARPITSTPLPSPPPQGGREQTAVAARAEFHVDEIGLASGGRPESSRGPWVPALAQTRSAGTRWSKP